MNLKEQLKRQMIDEQLSSNQIVFRDFIIGFIIVIVILNLGIWIKGLIFGG